MPKFAANLTMLYHDCDFLDRFQAAAESGFKGVDTVVVEGRDAEEIHKAVSSLGSLPG